MMSLYLLLFYSYLIEYSHEVMNIGFSTIIQVLCELATLDSNQIQKIYLQHGDMVHYLSMLSAKYKRNSRNKLVSTWGIAAEVSSIHCITFTSEFSIDFELSVYGILFKGWIMSRIFFVISKNDFSKF
jgi:hypothetical protein